MNNFKESCITIFADNVRSKIWHNRVSDSRDQMLENFVAIRKLSIIIVPGILLTI